MMAEILGVVLGAVAGAFALALWQLWCRTGNGETVGEALSNIFSGGGPRPVPPRKPEDPNQ